ncbi:MAG: apolipoprotein N-acyltransferase, partial [Microbacteriaceae bacterium]
MSVAVPFTVPLPIALLLALAGGPILDAAFPDLGIWPLALPGVVLALLVARGRRLGSAFLVGFVFGESFYLLHIEWATEFLGLVPWAALSTLMALWWGLGTMLITLAYRWVPRVWPGVVARLVLLPVVVAGIWTAREGIASVWPYGGFAWGRVALSQSASPVSPLFSLVGIAGVTFLLVVLAALVIEASLERRIAPLLRGTLAVATATALVVIPGWPVVNDGTIRVGAVQGNAKAGYFDPPDNVGDNLLDQVEATLPILEEDLDVVLWPEGASDIDPQRSAAAARIFDQISERADAPLVAGTITMRGEEYFNTSVLWKAGEGVVDFYDKKHPVPFGEYVPDRDFWRPFAPDLIDLVQREYTPGTTDITVDLNGVSAALNICFDIVDDQILTESVEEGARAIFASSNTADFGRTDESAQQLAIARIRAMELGRSVVNISTVGLSAVIAPDGRILQQLPWFEVGSMVQNIDLSSDITP